MIQDLDRTIERLLQLEFGAPLPFDISFAVPDQSFVTVSSARSTLNCYLYEIAEDRALRSVEPVRRAIPGGSVQTERPPLRLKLSYCITAWSPATPAAGRDPVFDEHALLSEVIVALLRHPAIPPQVLQGRLKDVTPQPTATLLVEPLKPRDFWNAIGGRMRPALEYSVTIAVPYDTITAGPMVSSVRLRVADGDATHAIGGIVRTASQPKTVVHGAWVRIDETGETLVTGSDGGFRIAPIREGNYTLVIRAVGFKEASRAIAVPGDNYDMELVGL